MAERGVQNPMPEAETSSGFRDRIHHRFDVIRDHFEASKPVLRKAAMPAIGLAVAGAMALGNAMGDPAPVGAQSSPGTDTPFPTAQETPTTEGTVSASGLRPNKVYAPAAAKNAEFGGQDAPTAGASETPPAPGTPTDKPTEPKPSPSPSEDPTATATATKETSVIPEGAYFQEGWQAMTLTNPNNSIRNPILPTSQMIEGGFGIQDGVIKVDPSNFEVNGNEPAPFLFKMYTPDGTVAIGYDPVDRAWKLATGENLTGEVVWGSQNFANWSEVRNLLTTEDHELRFQAWMNQENVLELVLQTGGGQRIEPQRIQPQRGTYGYNQPGQVNFGAQVPVGSLTIGFNHAREKPFPVENSSLRNALTREGVMIYIPPKLDNKLLTQPQYLSSLLSFNGSSFSKLTGAESVGLYFPPPWKVGQLTPEAYRISIIKEWQKMHGLLPANYETNITGDIFKGWEDAPDDASRAEFDHRIRDAVRFGYADLTPEQQQQMSIVVFNDIYPYQFYDPAGPQQSPWVDKFNQVGIDDFVHHGFEQAYRAGAHRVGQRIPYFYGRESDIPNYREHVLVNLEKQEAYTFTDEEGNQLLGADGKPVQLVQDLILGGENYGQFKPEEYRTMPSRKTSLVKDLEAGIRQLRSRVSNIGELSVEVGIEHGIGFYWDGLPESQKPRVMANIMEEVLKIGFEQNVSMDLSGISDKLVPYLSDPAVRERMMNILNQRLVTRQLQNPALTSSQRSRLQEELNVLRMELDAEHTADIETEKLKQEKLERKQKGDMPDVEVVLNPNKPLTRRVARRLNSQRREESKARRQARLRKLSGEASPEDEALAA